MFILLLSVCAFLSALVIIPLYYLATNFQLFYSFSVILLLVLLLLFIIIRQIKKNGGKAALAFTVKFLAVTLSVSVFFMLVLQGKRIPAIIALPAGALIYILASKIFRDKRAELSSDRSK